MSDDFEYDVFLSYSSKDEAVARDLAGRLQQDGLNVWFDEWMLKPGDSISAKIEEGLERSRVLILCMSANAFGSDWARLETYTFRFRDPLNKERRFLPLRLDEAQIKGSLVQFLFINWLSSDRDQEYPRLLEACRFPLKEPEPKVKPGWLIDIIRLEKDADLPKARLTRSGFKLSHPSGLPVYAFNDDGSRAIVCSSWGQLCLWDLETSSRIRVLGQRKSIDHIEWSRDEKRALLWTQDGKVQLIDVDQNRLLVDYGSTLLSKRQMDCFRLLACGYSSFDIQKRLGLHSITIEEHLLQLRERLGFKSRDELRQYVTNFYSGKRRSRFPPIRIHPRWAPALAWKIERDQTLSKKGEDFHKLRICTEFDGGTDATEERRHMSNWHIAWKKDNRHVALGTDGGLVTLWDAKNGVKLHGFEGHLDRVESLSWDASERLLLSGSTDETVKLWDMTTGRLLYSFGGFNCGIRRVHWMADGSRAIVGDSLGRVILLDLSEFVQASLTEKLGAKRPATEPDQVQYTNAKILLVGDTNAGKTALAHRLATGAWKPSEDSTVGAWSTQWRLADSNAKASVDREIWLWDFGGQADQRLIHQLYMDRAALILLLFNSDQEDVLPGLRDWQTALRRCVKEKIPHCLVAGRIDTGFKASRGKLQTFAKEQGLAYHETSAKEGIGCDELRAAIIESIPWEQMEKRTSPRIFKLIKDEILKLRDEGQVLHTFKELRELLWRRLPDEPRFTDEILQTVIALLDGPGVVKELEYGTYILLAPEWINAYAQAVIRTLRSAENELGVLPLRSIAEGKLIYQSIGRDGASVEMKRLPPAEERVVLGEMELQLEQRGLCLRQGDKLVFPGHCGRDRPAVLEHPAVFVSYVVNGFLDDIYATLVVKLADSDAFKLTEIWREAADFVTLRGDFHMGIKLTRQSASTGEISVYFGKGVTQEEQVIFANFIHSHLSVFCENAQRLRFYVCPKCNTPKGNSKVLMEKLQLMKQEADTECDRCGNRFPLWDALEQKFADFGLEIRMGFLHTACWDRIDSRRKGKLLALEVAARINSADQKCFEIPGTEDEGIDMELEFTDNDGKGTGRRLYLQLKAGNSHLRIRKSDGSEIFPIKEQRWVKYWMAQKEPVMLVIGTIDRDMEYAENKLEFTDVRWMEITSVLKSESKSGKRQVKQIEFKGERLDLSSVRRWRDRILVNGVIPD